MTEPRREEQGARAPRARLQIGPICCERKRTAAPSTGSPRACGAARACYGLGLDGLARADGLCRPAWERPTVLRRRAGRTPLAGARSRYVISLWPVGSHPHVGAADSLA